MYVCMYVCNSDNEKILSEKRIELSLLKRDISYLQQKLKKKLTELSRLELIITNMSGMDFQRSIEAVIVSV